MKQLLIIPVMAFLSCTQQPEPVPADVLTRERFQQVMLEAELIEARMNHELIVAHHSMIPSEQYYNEMFAAHNTTKEKFQRSFDYWTSRPEEMKAIYEAILIELSRRKDEQQGQPTVDPLAKAATLDTASAAPRN